MREFLVKCPRCHGPATGVMQRGPISGNYREALVREVPRKIVCPCGYSRDFPAPYDASKGDSYRYELYLSADVGGNTLWAVNREHAEALRNFIQGNRDLASRLNGWYALPRWMLVAKRRDDVIKALSRLISVADRVLVRINQSPH